MPSLYVKILVFCGALFFAAFFAFLETAFTAIRLFRVKELAERLGRYRTLFDTWERNPQRILISILIASNLADVICSVAITDIIQVVLGDTGAAFAIGVGLATVLILVFGEIIPKTLAKTRQEVFANFAIGFINVLFFLFGPFVSLLLKIVRYILPERAEEIAEAEVVSEKEIEFLIGYSTKSGGIERSKIEMLQNVFELGQTLGKEIMVPSTDMITLDVNAPIEKALALFNVHRFTRIPVYDGREDDIIGLILQKDLFEILYQKEQNKTLRDIVRPILLVPETMRVHQLLTEFRENRCHMAILLDEYGAVIGLVTLEDVIEEIVGEIVDEHETIPAEIEQLADGSWLIDARADLDDVSRVLGIPLDAKDSETLGGFVSEKLQHLPQTGERVVHQGYCFVIQRASTRRVYQVLVSKEPAAAGDGSGSKHNQ